MAEKIIQTAGRDVLGEFAPEFAHYNDDVLFGENWNNVTFEPGCRNNWHIHHADKGGGQILICTAGEGWYQEEGKEAQELLPGTVIVIPEGVKHWHGAKADSWFSHISVEVPAENGSNEWLEPVTDATYFALPSGLKRGSSSR